MNQIITKAVEEFDSRVNFFINRVKEDMKVEDTYITSMKFAFFEMKKHFTQKLTEAYMAGRSDEREMIRKTLEEFPLPQIGQDGGAWRDAFKGFLTLLIRDLEQAKQPPTQGCCDACKCKNLTKDHQFVRGNHVCDKPSCICHSVKDNN